LGWLLETYGLRLKPSAAAPMLNGVAKAKKISRRSAFKAKDELPRKFSYARERWIWGCFIVGGAARMAPNAGNDEIYAMTSQS
jgi:hypothetical protein